MIDALWPIIVALLGYVLIGLFVGLGYLFRFKLGSVIGVVLFSVPIIYLYFAIKDGMGMILMFGIVSFSPLFMAGIAVLAFSGQLLKDRQTQRAMGIIGVMAGLWTAIILLGLFSNWSNS